MWVCFLSLNLKNLLSLLLCSTPISRIFKIILQNVSGFSLFTIQFPISGLLLSVLMQTSPNTLFIFNCSLLIWYNGTTLINLKYHFDFLNSIFKVDKYYINAFSPLIYYSMVVCISTQRSTLFFSTTSWYFMMWLYHKLFNHSPTDRI